MSVSIARTRGFTLIELSIALVIIGLIAGGIIIGSSLIRQAELRKVSAEKDKLVTNIYSFTAKYNCLPGDCTKATEFFGEDPEGCSDPLETDKNIKTQTCNGNGNKMIFEYPELYTAWQQLAAAGLWEGQFAGSALSTNPRFDQHVYPPLSIDKTQYWSIDYGAPLVGFLSEPYSEHIILITPYPNQPLSLLTATEAYALDSKLDDGYPNSGKIMIPAGMPYCTDLTAPFVSDDAIYLTSTQGKYCDIVFNDAF